MGVERMKGTPWHIETHKVTYEKKRKSIFDKKRNNKDMVDLPKPEPRLLVGALFSVMDLDSGEILDFEVVRSENIDGNQITPKAPIAIEVAKTKVGDIIVVNDSVQYEVLKVDNRNKAQREKSQNKKKKKKSKEK